MANNSLMMDDHSDDDMRKLYIVIRTKKIQENKRGEAIIVYDDYAVVERPNLFGAGKPLPSWMEIL